MALRRLALTCPQLLVGSKKTGYMEVGWGFKWGYKCMAVALVLQCKIEFEHRKRVVSKEYVS